MIGILKGSLDNKDKDFFAVHSLNQLSKTKNSSCLFCDNISDNFVLPLQTNVLQRTHMFNFNGIIICDDLMLSQDLLYATYAKKRFIYLYHLDWPYIQGLKFGHLKRVLLHESIELIARNEGHYQLIEHLFKKPRYIMAEWDYSTLIEIDENE
ncbi:hypothetical protein CL634_01355 [bacterium]|nr:hypothetical protein [bacterium]|tara:strand:+ start:849 stop:1307 length:459 start_codon:yes stop_codon:yes gene_type:complete